MKTKRLIFLNLDAKKLLLYIYKRRIQCKIIEMDYQIYLEEDDYVFNFFNEGGLSLPGFIRFYQLQSRQNYVLLL